MYTESLTESSATPTLLAMFSKAILWTSLVAALGLGTLSVGCGRRGDPQPAPRAIPQAASDLEVLQRGAELLLRLTYPTTTVSGFPLGRLDSLVIEAVVHPEEASVVSLPERDWSARAQVLLELRGEELTRAVWGGKLAARVPAPSIPTGTRLTLAVRTRLPGREWSALSNRVAIHLRNPPPPPQEPQLVLEPKGVRIRWQLPAAEYPRLRIYRRLADEMTYSGPLVELAASNGEYLDSAVEQDRRYIYALTLLDAGSPPAESALLAEREILVEDRFAPQPPSQVRALSEPGRVRLLWEASPDRDLAGYLVERQEPGRDVWRTLLEAPQVNQSFEDSGLVSGLGFRYRIRAVDRAGNRSEPSEVVEVSVP